MNKANDKKPNADRKQIRFGSLLELINEARGKKTLAAWVKEACMEKLEREKKEWTL